MDIGLFVDIFVGIVLLISVGIAFMRGFIREVLTIFGIAGGMLAAYIGGPLLIPFMRGWLSVDESVAEPEMFMGVLSYATLADVLSYVAVFVVFVIILSVISHFIAEFAKNLGLGALDRTLGVVFGLARGVLVLGLLNLLPYYAVPDEQKEEYFGSSKTHVYLDASSAWLSGFLPEDARDDAKAGVAKAEEASEIRKKVEELGVLGDAEEIKENVRDMLEQKNDGYSEEFRDKMDALIEDQIEQPNNFNE